MWGIQWVPYVLSDTEYAQEGVYDIMKVDFVKITIHFLQCVIMYCTPHICHMQCHGKAACSMSPYGATPGFLPVPIIYIHV